MSARFINKMIVQENDVTNTGVKNGRYKKDT